MTETVEFQQGSTGDLADFQLAGRIANKLNEHYPGHLWAVNLNSQPTGGVVNIRNMAVSSLYGYVLHLTTVLNDPTMACVIKAGGEILERARMARGRAKGEFATVVDGKAERHQNFNKVVV